ncbi:DUF1707 domain-containing protein [Corynebacterium suicordis]|uniref:DUF1707 domain-containing protein n=1 Tax=Corynebacterium suicordis DSM 45110 TaxID=1121369 RepID=A0ABR9ZHX2_9CORY|nr:DUF1707 domain-containing protein [Corynebacterium suicordis]MBF4552993.1 DUF1707 domain-containing protein [Corynebacterium suicordis DSM 45110]MDR6278045.1 hypothetical protein [Corynebacterium suicordis]
MNHPGHPNSPHLRVSDPERQDAITVLGSHFAEGRLTLDEFELRSSQAANAVHRGDLDAIFRDLPALSPGSHLMPMYSAAEIERVRRNGAKPKPAILGLTAIGAVGASIILSPIWASSAVLLLLIPAVALLLYVAKVGPDSWHAPSQKRLERNRLRAIRMERQMEIEQRKAQRRAQRDELTHNAMQFANKSIGKRINRHN